MKKLIALLTVTAMLAISVFQIPASAEFSDVGDTNPYKKAITTLSTLSVISGYDDNTFKPDGAITRAEFTKLVVFMLGLQDIEYTQYTFGDVDPTHWARNYIQTGYNRGIIAGFDDGTFKSEESVTYAQALKMVVCTLGYESFALQLPDSEDSGWADKYIQEAGALGLTKGITGTEFYGAASRGVVAQILYNALEIDMYESNGYGSVKTEKTLLNDYLKVKRLKGTLVGIDDDVTEDCTITLPEQYIDVLTAQGEEVLIDYSSYTQQASTLTKYLGSTITLYYRQVSENDDRLLVNIDTETTKNSVTEINSRDIGEYDGATLKYYESSSSKAKTLKLRADEIAVRYNGKVVAADDSIDLADGSYNRSEALSEWLNPGSNNFIYGTVSLTDNGGDGSYDMIQIYDYETIVALSTPTTTDYRISDKITSGNYLILDPQSSSYEYTIKKDGADIPITSIAANDVVLYARSLDGEQYTLIVTNKTATGQITAISSSNNEITVGGQKYRLGDKCADYIRDKENKEIKTGASGTFYLDAFGTAVFGTIQEVAASPYAYITNAFREDGKFFVSVYAPSNNASEATSYPLKNTVKVNGVSTKAESAVSKIQAAAEYTTDESEYADKIYGAGKMPQNTQYAQAARVKIVNNEVTDIVLLTSSDVAAQNEDKEQIMKCRELYEYTYSNSSFMIDGKTSFSVNSSTTVIYVPQDRDMQNKYAKKAPSSAFSSGERYYIEAYDINSSRTAGMIILYGNDGTLTKVKKDSDFSVVAKTPENEYNSVKEDTVLKIDMFTGASNTIKSWNTYDTTEFKDVEVGDIIQFAYDSNNLIQGRINNIKFADIAEVLDGDSMNNGQLYNWEETVDPTEENNMQTMKFDYRFKVAGTSNDEVYTSSTYGTVPNSRAVMFNVSQVLADENKIYVTKSGFDEVDGTWTLNDENYEEIPISSSTKFVRMETERDEISPYVPDTTSNLTINDLKDAKNYGTDCSKILVFMSKGTAKLVIIYN